MNLNMELLHQLVNLVRDARISELTLRVGDWRVTIRKGAPLSAPPSSSTARRAAGGDQSDEVAHPPSPSYVPIVSSWVGIVRRQHNGKPLVQVGDTVRKGQTVCWIDALGVRNEVRAPESGRIVEIFVEDGQSVEFGQQLMLLEPHDRGGE